MRYDLIEKIIRAPTLRRRAAGAAALLALAGGAVPRSEWRSAFIPVSRVAPAQIERAVPALDPMPLVFLDLNLPAYRLDVFLRNERVRSYRVAIGMPGFRTPRGTFESSQLQWNPWWVPPKKEWAKNERVTPPGPTNPMGKVKFSFLPLYFIHGTPDEESLGKASSHGCVRLANADAIDLATLIQRTFIGPVASDSVLMTVLPTLRTTIVKLHTPIPVVIRYDLSDVVADTLFVYPDPYRMGTSPATSVLAALARAGLDTTTVDFASVRRFSRYPARVPVAMRVRRPPWPVRGDGPTVARLAEASRRLQPRFRNTAYHRTR